jgi:hypothetical protein
MKKVFENVTRLTTRKEYNILRGHIELFINEATAGGYFSDPEGDNEYIREFGRLARLSALFEDEYMSLNLTGKNRIQTHSSRNRIAVAAV